MTERFVHLTETDPAKYARKKAAYEAAIAFVRLAGLDGALKDDTALLAWIFDEPDHAAAVHRILAEYAPDLARHQVLLTAAPEIGDITVLLLHVRHGLTAREVMARHEKLHVPDRIH